jgi:hypothetical protein
MEMAFTVLEDVLILITLKSFLLIGLVTKTPCMANMLGIILMAEVAKDIHILDKEVNFNCTPIFSFLFPI